MRPIESKWTRETKTRCIGAELMEERDRQVEEKKYTPELDDENNGQGQLARAAAAYASYAAAQSNCLLGPNVYRELCPWPFSLLKLDDRRKNLVKAGALIIAEIERIDRQMGQH